MTARRDVKAVPVARVWHGIIRELKRNQFRAPGFSQPGGIGLAAMTRLVFAALLGLVLLAGCAHNYVITLNSGIRVNTTSKPRLEQGLYHFKNAAGQEMVVPKVRVREIAPASMAKDETFKPAISR